MQLHEVCEGHRVQRPSVSHSAPIERFRESESHASRSPSQNPRACVLSAWRCLKRLVGTGLLASKPFLASLGSGHG